MTNQQNNDTEPPGASEPDRPDGGPSQSRATIVDVARAAGVSHSTVSRVLNGHPHIRAETRTRVEEALTSLGYVANLSARSLAGGRVGVVGLVVFDLESAYTTQVVRAVDGALAEADLHLMLVTTRRRARKERSLANQLASGMADGIIVVIPTEGEQYPSELAERGYPFVLVDHAGSALANSVTCDNATGTRLAVEHLADLGHRRVAMITGDLDRESARTRLSAFRRTVAEHGLDTDGTLIVQGDYLERRGYEAMQTLLDLPEPPTAVFTSSDTGAFGALRAARQRGIDVPRELSIVGFDDIPEADVTVPGLTTVRQPLGELGRRAVELLQERMAEPDRTPSHVMLPVELVVRGTTGPAPG